MPKKFIQKECAKHGMTDYVLEGRGSYRCRRCRVDHVTLHRQKRKQELVALLGARCAICGYNKCQQALQFHHINEKEFGISAGGLCRSWDRMVAEADKCVLLCANCHAEVENGITQLGS